jgi:putative ABC transport system substrate-binding protein
LLRHRRRAFIDAIAGAFLAAPHSARPQPSGKVWRIGSIGTWPPAPENPEHAASIDAFNQALAERGYVVGKNLAYEMRYAHGKAELYPALAAELVRLKSSVGWRAAQSLNHSWRP